MSLVIRPRVAKPLPGDTTDALKNLHLDVTTFEDWGFRPGAGPGECRISGSVFSKVNGVKTGLWRCEPGSFNVEDRPNTESVQILSGKVRLTDLKKTAEDGSGAEGQVLGAGDFAVLELGSSVRWEIIETCVKFFVIADKGANIQDAPVTTGLAAAAAEK